MSIWNKPIFRKARTQTPAGEVAVRCARIRAASDFSLLPASLLGVYLGVALLFTDSMALLGLSLVRMKLFSATAALSEIKKLNPVAPIVLVVLAGLILWMFPRLARWMFDRRVAGITRETLLRHRRFRRSRRTVFKVGAVCVVFAAMMLAMYSWQSAALLCVYVTAISGPWVVLFGVWGRRGHRLVCAKCGYPMLSWRGAEERCSECGGLWRQPWGAKCGNPVVRWKWVWTGLGLTVASMIFATIVGLWGLKDH